MESPSLSPSKTVEKNFGGLHMIADALVNRNPDLNKINSLVESSMADIRSLLASVSEDLKKALPKDTLMSTFQEREFDVLVQILASVHLTCKDTTRIRLLEAHLRGVLEALRDFNLKSTQSYTFLAKTTKAADIEKEKVLLKKKFVSFQRVIIEIVETAKNIVQVPLDDFMLEDETSARWLKLKTVMEEIVPNEKSICLTNYAAKASQLLGLLATLGKGSQRLPKTEKDIDIFIKKLSAYTDPYTVCPIEFADNIDKKARENCDEMDFKFGVRMAHYNSKKNKAIIDGFFIVAQSDPVIFKKMFNFVEKSLIRRIRSAFEYPSIAFNVKFYVPPTFLERVCVHQNLKPLKLTTKALVFMPEELICPQHLTKDTNAIRIRFLCNSKLKNLSSKLKQEKKKKTGTLSNPSSPAMDSSSKFSEQVSKDLAELDGVDPDAVLPVSPTTLHLSTTAFEDNWLTPEEKPLLSKVMFYIHGGGFAAMSSSSHQNYLLKWAIELGVPIFSVDYRLAPAVQYPEIPNDVIRSYVWMLAFLKYVLKVEPTKILVSGDSAGGNLAAVLTTWCIENSVRAPDHLLVHYPATLIDDKRYTPSLNYSFTDYMLNYGALRMCISYYVPKGADGKKTTT